MNRGMKTPNVRPPVLPVESRRFHDSIVSEIIEVPAFPPALTITNPSRGWLWIGLPSAWPGLGSCDTYPVNSDGTVISFSHGMCASNLMSRRSAWIITESQYSSIAYNIIRLW